MRLTVPDARRRYPRVGAALDAPDVRTFLAGLDATGLAALLAEFQALGPVRLERRPVDAPGQSLMPMDEWSVLRETVGHGSLKWLPLLLALIGYNGLFAARLQNLADERVVCRWRKPVAVGLLVMSGVWQAAQAALSILLR